VDGAWHLPRFKLGSKPIVLQFISLSTNDKLYL
jgi:hypothetical protein